jgi:hypothetical protein
MVVVMASIDHAFLYTCTCIIPSTLTWTNVTCFSQWETSEWDTGKGLKVYMHWGLLSCCWKAPAIMDTLRLVHWRMSLHPSHPRWESQTYLGQHWPSSTNKPTQSKRPDSHLPTKSWNIIKHFYGIKLLCFEWVGVQQKLTNIRFN